MQQADRLRESAHALKAAQQQRNVAEEELKKAQAEIKTLQNAAKENTELKAEVARLKEDAEKVQENLLATIEADQNRLIAEQEEDTTLRMQMAWTALYPDSDYGHWEQAFQYAEEVLRRKDAGESLLESFEAWVTEQWEEPAAGEPH